jgi:hypothetical protein
MSQISEACGGGDAGRALVPGSLRGYRTWRLLGRRTHVPPGTLPLTSVTRHRVVWTPTLTARCRPDDTAASGGSPAPDDHHAPQTGCGCGVYGWYSPNDTGIVRARVFGVIEASGLVLLGERGFRAEKARIVAVVTRNRRVTEACAKAGIAVYRSRRQLLRDHPPEDLTGLIGPPSPTGSGAPAPSYGFPPLAGFDRFVFLAVWGRAALIASALVALPRAPALVTAIVMQVAVLALIALRFRH